MPITAIASLGTVLKKEGAVIANVKSISGPALTRDLADVTNLSSPNGFEEVLPTVLRTGDVSFALSFDPDNAEHLNLRDDVVTASGKDFEIIYPPTAASGTVQTHAFTAYVTSYSNEVDIGSEITADVTLKPTSTITVTVA
jgi:hypothetical protein